jgi:hypothetical protein
MRLNSIATKTFAVGTALTLVLTGCGGGQGEPATNSAPEGEATTGAVATQVSSASWKEATTAEEAATGAKIDEFGVMRTVKVDDFTFEQPKYSFADGVAQATYETGSASLAVRKADGEHTAPLCDFDKTDFTNKTAKSIGGVDVYLYGPAKGAYTVATWVLGTAEYGVTYQGTSGNELTMDGDEVEAIVRGISEENGTTLTGASQATGTESTSGTESSNTSGTISGKGSSSDDTSTTTSSTTTSSTTGSKTGTGSSTQTKDGFVSAETAASNAIACVGDESSATNVNTELVEVTYGSYYVVTFGMDGTSYEITVDAGSGAVWDIQMV